MRFLKLQVLLLLLAVLAVGALAFDVVLKGRAEAELADEVARRVPGSNGVRAQISSFPFVGRLLLSGDVSKVVVTAQHAGSDEVALSNVRVQVEDVEMDSGEAMDGRAVVKSIGRGSVRADLRQDQINSRLPRGYQVQMQEGKAVVSGPAASQAQLVTTPEGTVQLRIAGRSLVDVPFPKTRLLPCSPTAAFVSGAVRLTCTFDEVPDLLLDLGRA
jgi:hypothetical protein